MSIIITFFPPTKNYFDTIIIIAILKIFTRFQKYKTIFHVHIYPYRNEIVTSCEYTILLKHFAIIKDIFK